MDGDSAGAAWGWVDAPRASVEEFWAQMGSAADRETATRTGKKERNTNYLNQYFKARRCLKTFLVGRRPGLKGEIPVERFSPGQGSGNSILSAAHQSAQKRVHILER
jgi:hypothetical protein